ncbi:MAG: type II secretion system protein [bacterium]|nr:type II secretion system protein [bacterium]
MKGFTLIEMLLSLGIVILISFLGVTSLSNFNKDKALLAETENVLALLSKARAYTLSAKEGASYGVHFEERKTVLFTGPTYTAGVATNKEQGLNGEVKISALSLVGGGSEVLFTKLTGGTAQSGTVTLASVRNASQTKVVTITATGIAYSN